MTEEQRERKLQEMDKLIHKLAYWGVVLRIPKAMVRIAQGVLGLPEVEATWLIARRHTDVDLPESLDGLSDE